MKKLIILVLALGVSLSLAQGAEAKTLQTYHKKGNKPYNCEITKAPARPKWVWYRYPDPKHPTRDAYGNGKVHLIWEDSDRAHQVEIRYSRSGGKKKTEKTADDAQAIVKGLKNGKKYTFQVRGVSNCGTGKWSNPVRILP